MRRILALASVVAIGTALAACDTGDGRTLDPPRFGLPATTVATTTVPLEGGDQSGSLDEPVAVSAPMQMFASWPDGAILPERHTCDGEGVSPALDWIDVPPDAVELVVTLTNLDDGLSTWWIVDAIATTTPGLPEGSIPPEAFERANSSGEVGYEAPCPPAGESQLFQFTLHALNQQLEVADDATSDEILSFLNQTALDQSSVSAIVTRSG